VLQQVPRVGDPVTVMPPWDQDPVIIAMQHYARVASVDPDALTCMVSLDATSPPGQTFGPFPLQRLASGWRDETGRWRAS
jgi:hypothetical protein